MQALYSKDLRMLVGLELERNAKLRAVVGGYEELTETEKAMFRLAVGIAQDTTGSSGERRRRSSSERGSRIGRGEVQPLVQSLMETLLEDYPTLLDDADILNLLNREHCKTNLGLQIGNLILLWRMENGTEISGHKRYWAKVYAGRFYVCNNWWRDYHLANANSLLRFVGGLVQRNPNHPGVPALEGHRKALRDYIG